MTNNNDISSTLLLEQIRGLCNDICRVTLSTKTLTVTVGDKKEMTSSSSSSSEVEIAAWLQIQLLDHQIHELTQQHIRNNNNNNDVLAPLSQLREDLYNQVLGQQQTRWVMDRIRMQAATVVHHSDNSNDNNNNNEYNIIEKQREIRDELVKEVLEQSRRVEALRGRCLTLTRSCLELHNDNVKSLEQIHDLQKQYDTTTVGRSSMVTDDQRKEFGLIRHSLMNSVLASRGMNWFEDPQVRKIMLKLEDEEYF